MFVGILCLIAIPGTFHMNRDIFNVETTVNHVYIYILIGYWLSVLFIDVVGRKELQMIGMIDDDIGAIDCRWEVDCDCWCDTDGDDNDD